MAFVWALAGLRKHFKVDPRLDWFFLLSFFGVSYYWGFFTFLTAAPIATLFILVADCYAQEPSFKRGMATTLLGIVLLASHGLMFAMTFLIALTLPVFAMATGLLYLRFALFTLPACALMFTLSRPAVLQQASSGRALTEAVPIAERIAVPLMIAVTWLMLGQHSWHAWRFSMEARDCEAVLAPMQPAQRALSLLFAQRSEAANNDYAYLHFATWYQSEKQGLVDFNFAWLPPQMARFRPDRLPAVTYDFEHSPRDFNWHKHHGENYR